MMQIRWACSVTMLQTLYKSIAWYLVRHCNWFAMAEMSLVRLDSSANSVSKQAPVNCYFTGFTSYIVATLLAFC